MAIGSVSSPSARGGTQLQRGDGQDPRATPDVEHPRAREDAAVGQRLDAGQAQPGRRMQPGPERHPRIEREDDVVGRPAMAPPGRPDDQPPADAHDREVGLPGVCPVGLLDDPGAQLADRAQPECLEVTERLGHLGRGSLGGARSRAGRYARTIAGRLGSSRAPRPSSTSSNAGSTDVPPGAARPRISLTASTASTSASTDSSSHAPDAAAPSRPDPSVNYSPSFSSRPPPWPTDSLVSSA